MNIAQGVLPFQLIPDTSKVLMTSFGGLPLVMETFRASLCANDDETPTSLKLV